MAHIEDRWYKTVVIDNKQVQLPKPGCGRGMRYRVRYLTPDGVEKSESFPDRRKRDAQAFLTQVQGDILNGRYIDPDAGKITFRRYSTEWLASATSDQNTRDRLARQFRLHVYPEFGDRPLLAIQPATLRAWLRRLSDNGVAPSYQRNLFNDASMILNAAVDDRLIPTNPFTAKTVHSPRYVPTRVIPWATDQLAAFREAVEARYRISVDLGSGCGLRQGEIFGVGPDDVDQRRRILHVRRQVKVIRERLVFAPPKGGKIREVPLPESVAGRLRAHAEEFLPVPVELPWVTLDGEVRTVRLYLTTPVGKAIFRSRFNTGVWKRAIRATGIEDDRRNGMHVLRHTYASVLLDAGESIKALSLYLGHADPGFTLRVYTHLLPNSEDRTRRAIDRAFGYQTDLDGPETV